jgi:alpha-glucosidase
MENKGIKLIPIIDPGVKIEKGYDVYEDGIKNGYFCKTENNEYFTAAVWPGLVHFPDFLNSEVQEWWGNLYNKLTCYGLLALAWI